MRNLLGTVDDKKAPENYTKEELIAEAKFVLSKYNPAEGYIHGEEILGEHGESAKTKALLERKQIEQFLKKHDKA